LIVQAPNLNDDEVMIGLFKLFAAVGDGHTLMFWPPGSPRLPVRLQLFKEGLFVTEATPAYADLLGAEVLGIGPKDIQDVLDELGTVIARDNLFGLRARLGEGLAYAQLVHGMGLSDSVGSVTLHARTRNGRTLRRRLKTIAANATPQWRSAAAERPLWLRHTDKPFWFEHLPAARAMYIQFNEGMERDASGETFQAFVGRAFDALRREGASRLIVDLRRNGGGTNLVNHHLIKEIIKTPEVNRRGRLFVLTSGVTFSAGQSALTDLERWTEVTTAGEPSGTSPNFIGETTRIVLPYSGLRASASSLNWQQSLPWDDRISSVPELAHEMTFADWVAGRDVLLDSLLSLPQD
jgi:hypothetical protein